MSKPRYLRRTARVLVTDSQEQCLLFRFAHPGWQPFWLTPGGECEPDETYGAAAQRELFEETGIEAKPDQLSWQFEYDYTTPDGVDAHAVEHWFRHRASCQIIDTTYHTELEKQSMQQHRWFTLAELDDWPETIYPVNLAALIAGLN
jgi:8-oxo-dGTP pyrophosphatase MutT (NUDIX family)